MQGLSHGVIRVDSEEKQSVLTLQDVGTVMPGGKHQGCNTGYFPNIPRFPEILVGIFPASEWNKKEV